MLLSKRQYKVLKRSRFLPDLYDELGATDQSICDFLEAEGLLENRVGFVTITEKGRAVLSQRFKSKCKFWIPIVISVIALLQPWLMRKFL